MKPANETMACYMDTKREYADRQLFVQNLGELLAQTRDGVVCCYLDLNEVVHIQYRGGGEHLVNVAADSYAAIVYDVAKGVT